MISWILFDFPGLDSPSIHTFYYFNGIKRRQAQKQTYINRRLKHLDVKRLLNTFTRIVIRMVLFSSLIASSFLNRLISAGKKQVYEGHLNNKEIGSEYKIAIGYLQNIHQTYL